MVEVYLVGLFGREYRKLVLAIPAGFEPWNCQEGPRRGGREQGTGENGCLSRAIYVEEGGTCFPGHRIRDRRPEEENGRQASGRGSRSGPESAPTAQEDQEVPHAGLPRGEQVRASRALGRLRHVRGGLPDRRREAPGRSPRRGVPPRVLPASAAVCGWIVWRAAVLS
jgi:hypothetical protein